jgi:superfamily II DNA or RNA helicase
MALKLDPVRLLIADDVGVGKTIEAALIARELLDRGDIERFAVLCPPHLVEQWVTELEGALPHPRRGRHGGEREPPGARPPAEREHLRRHPHTVVSLDYIKSERGATSSSHCPELVIVDEAHTCAATGRGATSATSC